jgi:hypothetical protein
MTKSAAASPDAPPVAEPAAAGPAETTPAAEAAPTPETTSAAEATPAPETTPAAEAAPAAETTPAAEAGGSTPAKDAKDGVKAKTSDLTAGPGGVMTNEVGVITGDLTLRSELDGTKLTLRVQYKEADEWYVVTGGKATLKDPEDLDAVHKIVVGILNRPEG